MSDYGIKISLPGVNVQSENSTSKVTSFNNPQFKLDTQNPNAFQNILLLIVNDPPEPVLPAVSAYTTVYKFAHGYTYVPSVETLFYIKTPAPGTLFYQQYFQDAGIIAAQNPGSEVILYGVADATYVYFIVDKINQTATPNLLTGTSIQISCHVFLDDIGV